MSLSVNENEAKHFKKNLSETELDSDLDELLDNSEELDPLEDTYYDNNIVNPKRQTRNFNRKNSKKTILSLLFIVFLLIGIWWYYSNNLNNNGLEAEFIEPEFENSIRITGSTFDNEENSIVADLESSTKVPVLEVDSNKIGAGQYYLEFEDCAFVQCVKRYEDLLNQSNLPISKQSTNKSYKFIQLRSEQYFPAENIFSNNDFEFIQNLLNKDVKLASASAGGTSSRKYITVGLFTTLQNAKSIKDIVEDAAKKEGINLTFTLGEVAVTQTITNIYSGPFVDKSTADKIKSELTATTPIKVANVVKLNR